MFGKKPVVKHSTKVKERDAYWAEGLAGIFKEKLRPQITIEYVNGAMTHIYTNLGAYRHVYDGCLFPEEFKAMMWLLAHLPDDVREKIGLVEDE